MLAIQVLDGWSLIEGTDTPNHYDVLIVHARDINDLLDKYNAGEHLNSKCDTWMDFDPSTATWKMHNKAGTTLDLTVQQSLEISHSI